MLDGSRTQLMGVINVTPDSFSDGGETLDVERAIERGVEMANAGALVLDIGGESTRPGAEPVSAAAEIARVVPVIEGLRERSDALLSVDTTKALVAERACAAGADIINDISGLTFEPDLAAVAAAAGASLIVMHIQGTPLTMQRAPRYADLESEVAGFLEAAVARAVAAGVPRERVMVDPGIGFGKRLEHNLALIAGCGALGRRLQRPVLMGVSRKSFLAAITGRPVHERLAGTAAAVCACVLAGAAMVRVHDVAEMRDVVLVADALKRNEGSIGGS